MSSPCPSCHVRAAALSPSGTCLGLLASHGISLCQGIKWTCILSFIEHTLLLFNGEKLSFGELSFLSVQTDRSLNTGIKWRLLFNKTIIYIDLFNLFISTLALLAVSCSIKLTSPHWRAVSQRLFELFYFNEELNYFSWFKVDCWKMQYIKLLQFAVYSLLVFHCYPEFSHVTCLIFCLHYINACKLLFYIFIFQVWRNVSAEKENFHMALKKEENQSTQECDSQDVSSAQLQTRACVRAWVL